MKTGIFVAIAAMAILASGCATNNLFEEKGYKKEVVKNSHVFFTNVWAKKENGKLVIRGQIKKTVNVSRTPKYVKVELVSSDGSIQETRKIGYVPRILSNRRRHRTARFSAEFDHIPPQGTIIRFSITD